MAKPLVWVIGGDMMVRSTVEMILLRSGIDVSTSGNMHEIATPLADRDANAVIIAGGVSDSADRREAFRAVRALSDAPVIMLVGRWIGADRADSPDRLPYLVMEKPFTSDALLLRLQEALADGP